MPAFRFRLRKLGFGRLGSRLGGRLGVGLGVGLRCQFAGAPELQVGLTADDGGIIDFVQRGPLRHRARSAREEEEYDQSPGGPGAWGQYSGEWES